MNVGVVRACLAIVLGVAVLASACGRRPSAQRQREPPQPFVLADDFTRCASDAECTIVSLGCCEVTPVRRDHAAETRTRLEASGKRYCPPKSACGPSSAGTWDGEPGVCKAGACAKP